MFCRTGVIADRSFTLQEQGSFNLFCWCDLDLDPMTFIFEFGSHFQEIYRMWKYEPFESYRLTDRQTDMTEIIHPRLRMWSVTVDDLQWRWELRRSWVKFAIQLIIALRCLGAATAAVDCKARLIISLSRHCKLTLLVRLPLLSLCVIVHRKKIR